MTPARSTPIPVVFIAIASSEVGRYRALHDLEQEYKELQALYEAAARAGRCELVTRFAVTLDDIVGVFHSQAYAGRIAVFHFAGHAEEDLLVLQNAAGDPLLAGAGGLAAFLSAQPNLQLFFINGCRTEAQVAALHAGGIPAVVATREEVPDEAARSFAVHFHRGLSTGAAIAQAFAAAQGALQAATFAAPAAWDPDLWLLSASTEEDKQWKLGDRQPQAFLPWRVPFLRNASFVGREQDLANLHAALIESTTVGIRPALATALLTSTASAAGLTGMGGIGKTQLAVEYCYRYREAYPGGIFWLNAAADRRAEFADLGTYLMPDLAGEPDVRRIRAAADYLNAHGDCLLVLDNVAEPPDLRRPVTVDLIPTNLRCRILLTTRSRNLDDFWPVEVTVLPAAPALQLLLRNPARQPVLDTAHPEHADAQRVCAVLGCLPLALEIAGAHLARRPKLTLASYYRELLARGALRIIDDPRGGVRDVDLGTRHIAAVAATLNGQWDAIESGDARLLLRVAAQLPEAAAFPVAQLGLLANVSAAGDMVFGSPLEQAAAELDRLSLIERLTGDDLRLHPLVREFAQQQTPAEHTSAFRRACALNLLEAYQDVAQMEHQCAQRGVDTLEVDLNVALHLLPDTEHSQPNRMLLRLLLRMLQHESHVLRYWNQTEQPALFHQQWHIRALISRLPQQWHAAAAALARRSVPYLELLWTSAGESAALERTLSGHTGLVYAVALAADGQRAVSVSADRILKVWDLSRGVELHNISGHTGEVSAVALTPDAQRAVSASSDRTLKVWDLATGAELHTLRGHTNSVNAVAVTADGQRAVSASADRTLKVWDLATGVALRTLHGHWNSVSDVALTPDGQHAVSASVDCTLKVWDLPHGAELHTLRGHRNSVNAVTVTPDGQRTVSASDDGTLKVWDLATGAELHTLGNQWSVMNAVVVASDGQLAVSVSGSSEQALRVWNLATGSELRTLRGHRDKVRAVTLAADGRRAVSASDDRTLKVWDLTTGAELHTLRGHTNWVRAVALTADGQRAVSASDDRTLKVWDLSRVEALPPLGGHTNGVSAVAVTADRQWAVSASADGTLKVWDLATGAELHCISGHTGEVSAVALTPDGRRVVSGSDDGTLKIWDLATGAELHALTGHNDAVNAVVVTSQKQRVVSASWDHTLIVWDVRTGRKLRTLSGHTDWVKAAAVTADGQRAISASADGTLKVWNLATGAELHTLRGHLKSVRAVAVTSDGQRAISASADHTLKVWDLARGAELHTLIGHTNWVSAVAVTANGRWAVSASDDRLLKVWDLATGTELHSLSGHMDRVSAVTVTADGQWAVSASWDNTLKVWDLATGSTSADITLDAPITCVQLIPDDITFIAGDEAGNVHCLRYRDPRRTTSLGS